tara:strand:+ start:568 stop:2196 length:1629 start_codon:yes stop_codon:yes gene_type:complete
MSNYTKSTNFTAKDSLPSGDANKVIRGSEFDTEFNALATAVATKADLAGPTFTGTATFASLTATGTVNFNGATISDLGTITTANLDGGTADNIVIGGATPAAGSFTSLAASSSLTIGGVAVLTSVTFSNLDSGAVTTSSETFADSDTQIPTNAAVKAHVEAVIPTLSVTESSVTAHQAALAIAASQLSDVTSTAAELNILDGVTSTAAELNILDGVTSTAAELNILDGVTSTAAELNILDGVTSTAAELNILDGVTATTAELNILDGVTSTASELNLVDGSSANTVVNSKAVIYGSSGEVTATQVDITGRGDLRLQDSAGGEYVGLQAPATVSSSFVLSLPAADGSADQMLKTDGSGNLSFTTVASGGLTHLSTVTASGASTVDIETTFDATYDAYKLIITDLTTSNDGPQITLLMKIGGSYLTAGYHWFLHSDNTQEDPAFRYSSGTNSGQTGTTYVMFGISNGNDSHANANYEINIHNPADTAVRHMLNYTGTFFEDDNDMHRMRGVANNNTTGALTGLRFAANAGTVSGRFRLYGITNG